LKTKDVNRLSLEEMAEILQHKKLIIDFLNAVEAKALELELAGTDVPGFKVVEGRSVRAWRGKDIDIEAVLTQYGVDIDDIYTRKLISPAQAEKVLGKKNFVEIEEWIIKPEGKPTLVADSDKRGSLTSVKDEFDFE